MEIKKHGCSNAQCADKFGFVEKQELVDRQMS